MNVASTLLARVFAALDGAEVEYCLLRGYNELVTPAVTQEVDLLLRRAHRAGFETVLRAHGFVAWPAWGHAPHRFYVAYDPDTDCWLKLDVVESLLYGAPVRWLEVRLADRCLQRRRRRGPTWIPAAEDQLVTLLLHCVLDKHRFRDTHSFRLLELWNEIASDREAKERLFLTLAGCLGHWEMLAVVQAFELQDWDDLLSRRGRWTRRLSWRSPLVAAWRRNNTLLARRARRLFFLFRRHGTSTVLLAPDGGGKSTLAAALTADPWLQARVVYMGSNPAAPAFRLPASRWLEATLRRQRRQHQHPLLPLLHAASAVNRILEDWSRYGSGRLQVLLGRFVVYDRYFYDTYLSPRTGRLRLRLRRWLLLQTCPAPDLVLLLDAPGAVLHERKGEHTPAALEAQRQKLLALGEKLPQCRILDTTAGADAVRRGAIAHIWERYAARHGAAQRSVPTSPREAAPARAGLAARERARVIS